jgi:hypothetical protein
LIYNKAPFIITDEGALDKLLFAQGYLIYS